MGSGRGSAAIVVVAVALIAAACSGSSDMGSLQESLDEFAVTGTTPASSGSGTPGTGDQGGLVPVDRPPPLRQSLAGLDSYRLNLQLLVSGTDVGEAATTIDLDYSRAAGGWHLTMNSTTDGEADEPLEMYWIDGSWCSWDGFDWVPAPLPLGQQEVLGVFWNQMDLVPTVERPELVGSEVFQGVPSRRYAFEITGLGLQSGAVPSEAAGEYWLAEDGGWLVGYRVALESRTGPESDPNAEVTSGDLSITVRDAGAPIAIQAPPQCALSPEEAALGGTLSGGTVTSPSEFGEEATPLPLRQGLAQLDAYSLTVGLRVSSVEAGSGEFSLRLDYSAAAGGWHQTLTSITEGEVDTAEVYWKEGIVCQFDGEVWSATEVAAQDQETIGVLWSQLDFVPVVGDPVLVGTETVSGVAARHYTFSLAGVHPGAVGTTSRGEYWLAEDGGYLLGYRAELATGTSDPTGAIDGEMTVALENINGQIAIDLPPECTAAPADG